MRKIPQANDLKKVIKFVEIIGNGRNSNVEIASVMNFDVRQVGYYGEAAGLLGLVNIGHENFNLTDDGKFFLTANEISRNIILINKILDIAIFKKIFTKLLSDKTIDMTTIVRLIYEFSNLNEITAQRRSSTVKSWLIWVGDELNLMYYKNSKFYLNSDGEEILNNLIS